LGFLTPPTDLRPSGNGDVRVNSGGHIPSGFSYPGWPGENETEFTLGLSGPGIGWYRCTPDTRPVRGHRRPSHSESGVSGSNDLHRFWDVCYVGHADDIKKHLWLRHDSRHSSRTRDPKMDPGLGPRKIRGPQGGSIFRRGPSSDAEIMDVCHDIIRSGIPNIMMTCHNYDIYIILYKFMILDVMTS
jgi:hypothetical protein